MIAGVPAQGKLPLSEYRHRTGEGWWSAFSLKPYFLD